MKRILSFSLLILSLVAFGSAGVLSAQTLVVDKPALSFSGQFGGSAVSQTVNVTSTGASIAFELVVPPGASWLKVNGQTLFSGSTPYAVSVSADPTGLNAGTYTANIAVITGSTTASPIQVTFTVSAIGVSPSSIALSYTFGSNVFPAATSLILSGSATTCTVAVSYATTGNWLSVPQGACASPGSLSLFANTTTISGLSAGTYTATITITPANGSPAIAVPVTLTVLPTPPATVNPASLTFNWQTGVSNVNPSQTFTISTTSTQPLSYGITAGTDTGTWLYTVTPSSGTFSASTPAPVTVTVNPAGLAAGSYNGRLTINTPGATPVQTIVPVTLVVSATALLNVPSATLNFTAQVGAAAPAAQTVNITATSGTLVYTVAQSANSAWLTVPTAGTTTSPLSVSVNPAGLNVGTYNATIVVGYATAGGATQSIPVVLTITNSPTIVANVSGLSFPFQIGQTVPPSQNIQVSSVTGVPLSYSAAFATTSCGAGWLPVNAPLPVGQVGGSYTLNVPVTVTGLAAGTCNGTATITATDPSTGLAAINSPLSVPITLYVSSSALLVVAPTVPPVFNAGFGAASPAAQSVTLTSTSTTVLNYTIAFQTANGGNWLSLNAQSGTTASNNTLNIGVISSALAAGTYTGTVTITATGPGGAAVANSPIVIPVTLNVTSGSLTLGATSLSFQQTSGGAAPAAQTVQVGSSGQALNYTAVANVNGNPVNWLTVTPASGNTANSNTLTISVDGSKLTAGATYTGTVIVTAPGAGNSPTTIAVSFTVAPGTLSAPTTTLTFTAPTGGPAPSAQTIAVTGSPAPLNFTVATSNNTPWLAATPLSGTTPGSVSVSVSAGSLAVGTYNGSITITSAGASGSPIVVPVVLNVVPPASFTVSPTSLSFSYLVGQAAPAAQNLALTGTSTVTASNLTAQVQPASAATWLSVTPTTAAQVPATFAVSVTPTGLTAGNYTANIVIAATNAQASVTIPVTLTVGQIPTPVVSAIGNAANYATGAVSPGENIVIFGTGIGPAALVHAAVSNNAFPTIAGQTQVLFDGVAAPVIYASAGQTSVMVPYGVSGRTTTSIVLIYSGVASSPLTYNVASAAPGIYTQNQQGNGPGSILNQDLRPNTPALPENRGNIVSVYMTGEGQTSPQGVDALLATTLKSPLQAVTATIGGVPATVTYAGSAPGLVYGIMQVNVQIPTTVTPGAAVPIVITVGTFSSQSGSNAVTLSVQ
jgi:uncharacterized protein (TIGR03437 family)